jgi:hypothetical protein
MTTDEPGTEPATAPSAAPVLRVVSPHATPEEVAALVAVLSALGGGEPAPVRRVPEWSRPARRHRAPVAHGPGGWRASGLPR